MRDTGSIPSRSGPPHVNTPRRSSTSTSLKSFRASNLASSSFFDRETLQKSPKNGNTNLLPLVLSYKCHQSKYPKMSEMAGATEPTPAPNAFSSPTSARYGHEQRIAQPSTFLLPRGHNRAMQDKPLTAVDKDQQSGLVSVPWTPRSSLKSCDKNQWRRSLKYFARLTSSSMQSGNFSKSARVMTFFLCPSDS